MTNQTEKPRQATVSSASDDVAMTTEITLLPDKLTLFYRVQNRSEQAIYLVNRVFKWTKTGLSVEPEYIYTEVADDTLRLIKANVDIPENVKVEAPDVPYLTLVDAQSEFSETITLALPLQPFHPYGQTEYSETIQTFTQTEFSLGWLPGPEITVNTVTPAGLTLLSASYQDVVNQQRLLTATFEIAIPTHIQKAD